MDCNCCLCWSRIKSRIVNRFSSCRWRDLVLSTWCALVFVGLGSSHMVYGSTVISMAHHLAVEVGNMAPMLAVRGVSSAVGNLLGGVCIDRLHKISFWLLTLVIFIETVATCMIPISFHLAMMGAAMMLQGIGYGFLQSGVYAVLLLVWKEKSGAILHMINFFFAVGAFFAPLMAKPFLSEEMMQVNVSCTEVFNMYDNHWTNLSNNSCMEMAERNCSDDISGRDWLLIDCPDPMADTMFYGWSYLLATIPLLLSFPAFMYYAVTRQNHCKPAPHAGDASGHELLVNRDSPESNFSSLTTSSSDSLYPNTWTYSIIVLVLLFIVTFLYTGLEMSFGSLLFTYAVRSRLHFSKSHATLLNSVFWGFIALGRLASIPLAICTPSTVMLSVSFAGSILSATLMTIYPYHHLAIWFGCALLGISLASVRPSTISWLNEHISASGKAVAVVLAGGSAGILSFPGAVASLVAYLNPISLIYFTMAVLICCSVLWCTLFLFARLSLICNKVPKGDTIYEEGNESVPLQEFSRQTENGGN